MTPPTPRASIDSILKGIAQLEDTDDLSMYADALSDLDGLVWELVDIVRDGGTGPAPFPSDRGGLE